jgi:uncharacterized NAD(P)/FAD-binding protein YdhS
MVLDSGRHGHGEAAFCDVAIVGGGFAGTVLALHLVRSLGSGHVAIVEPRAELGSGLAYSATDEVHRINVTARQMGVSAEAEDRFIDWLEKWYPAVVGGGLGASQPSRTFVQRRWFGEFVRERLGAALAGSKVKLEHHSTSAKDARVIESGLELMLANGGRLRALCAVVAASHGVPGLPSGFPAALADAPGFIADPWQADEVKRIPSEADVLILGTGLTMADVTGSLLANAHRGRIRAVSRHGLLSRPASVVANPVALDFASWPAGPVTVHLRRLRHEIELLEKEGGSWRDVFTTLRERSTDLWSKLSIEEKQRFVRHLKSFYDVHRYRMAPDLAGRIEAAREAGQVEVLAGRLRSARRDRVGFLVEVKRRGSSEAVRWQCRAIVNCTGPRAGLGPDSSDFLGALVARGLAYPDPLGLGLTVDRDGRVYGLSRSLFALGPLTRERFGDVVGAPEIAEQAQRLAGILKNTLNERSQDGTSAERKGAASYLSRGSP